MEIVIQNCSGFDVVTERKVPATYQITCKLLIRVKSDEVE